MSWGRLGIAALVRRRVLLAAHKAAARDEYQGTDDSSLVERMGLSDDGRKLLDSIVRPFRFISAGAHTTGGHNLDEISAVSYLLPYSFDAAPHAVKASVANVILRQPSDIFVGRQIAVSGSHRDIAGAGHDVRTLDQLLPDRISDSDIILFVHGDQRELEQIEVDYLKKLKEAFGREQARHHLIVVQNKIDRFAENEAGFERVKNRIREQCKEALGFEPYFFAVSATRYYNGKLKQKEALANKSGMPELMAQITSLAPNAEEFRHYRIVYSLRELQKQIKEQIDTLEAANSRDKKAFISYFAAFNQNIDVYKQHIADFKRRFAALESDEY